MIRFSGPVFRHMQAGPHHVKLFKGWPDDLNVGLHLWSFFPNIAGWLNYLNHSVVFFLAFLKNQLLMSWLSILPIKQFKYSFLFPWFLTNGLKIKSTYLQFSIFYQWILRQLCSSAHCFLPDYPLYASFLPLYLQIPTPKWSTAIK